MDWLAEMTSLFPNELIVTVDVQNRRVMTRGWSRTLPRDVLDTVSELNGFALGGLLVTAMHKEGQLGGTDLPLMEDVVELSNAPVIASGGITTLDDLRALADRGLGGAVIGSALYTGALDPRLVAEEFAD
jgi:phosphoribosylformimino-5-aminoimidazole carboxamide ribotide isomerase